MKGLFFLLLIFVVIQSFIKAPEDGLRAKLSDYSFFEGRMTDLKPGKGYEVYTPSATLFTDYAEKLRFRSLDGRMFAKTFYYYTTRGRRIIETRVLLLTDAGWLAGSYVWNAEQTEAFLSEKRATTGVSWVDEGGAAHAIRYVIPSKKDCSGCHNSGGLLMPIGPGLRDLPNWQDSSHTLAQRARAYLAANCAHCHNPKGVCAKAKIDFRYEAGMPEAKVLAKAVKYMRQGKMPQLGTTVVHKEGLALIEAFLNHQNK